MAEEVKETEGQGGDKLVCYKLTQALGDIPAGEIVHLPEDKGEALLKAGLAELADEKDVAGDEDEEDAVNEEEHDEEPILANGLDRLTKVVEKGMAEGVARGLQKKNKSQPTFTVPATVAGPVYKSLSEQIRDMYKAEMCGDRTARNRLREHEQQMAKKYKTLGIEVEVKAPLGYNEGSSAQGGYLVNPQFSSDVYAIEHNQLDLQGLCETIDAQSNTYNQRFVNESNLANGSIFGGVNMVATTEGSSFTSSLAAFSNVAFTLEKFAIFSYFTTEVLQDASYPIESLVNEYAAKAFLYGINTQIVQGSTIEGLLNAPSLVTVTHSSNDTSYTTDPSTVITYEDLAKIWGSVYPDSQASTKGIWLMHPSLVPALTQMTYTFSGSTPAWSINYDAQTGLAGVGAMTPYKIFGKPCYAHWACSAPGTTGDIIYVDFNTVKCYKKPFRVELSKEFQFGSDQVAYRWVSRLDAKTVFRNKITGPTGTQQFSAVVTRSGSGS